MPFSLSICSYFSVIRICLIKHLVVIAKLDISEKACANEGLSNTDIDVHTCHSCTDNIIPVAQVFRAKHLDHQIVVK